MSRTGTPSAARRWHLEKVTLYGLPIVAARQVSYGRIDPAAARDLFIRHALVEGDWQTHHRSSTTTGACSPTLRIWSAGPGGAASSPTTAALFDFYDQRIPAEVTSARHFDTWWKKARQPTPTC